MIKVLKFSSIAALVLLGSASCTDLKVNEIDSVVQSTDATFKPIDPTAGLLSAYKDLSAYTDQANIYALGSHTSAEMIPPTRGTDWGDNGVWRSLDQHTWNATHGQVTDAWFQLNQRVSRATVVLASNPSGPRARRGGSRPGPCRRWHPCRPAPHRGLSSARSARTGTTPRARPDRPAERRGGHRARPSARRGRRSATRRRRPAVRESTRSPPRGSPPSAVAGRASRRCARRRQHDRGQH